VWKIESQSSILYLAGTIHVLREQDYPLPQAFSEAFDQSSVLVFETDINQLKTAAFSQKLIQKMLLPEGKTLPDLLTSEVYTKLKTYCNQNGINLNQLQSFKPSLIVLNLVSLEMTRLGIAATGVDEYLFLKAGSKKTLFLETVDEQLDFLQAMGQGNEDQFVQQSLSELHLIKIIFNQMIQAWRTGDLKKLNKLLITDSLGQFPKMYQQLIVQRNRNWMPKIIRQLKTSETELVLVGTAHLIGKDGLIQQLKKRGYRVTQLN